MIRSMLIVLLVININYTCTSSDRMSTVHSLLSVMSRRNDSTPLPEAVHDLLPRNRKITQLDSMIQHVFLFAYFTWLKIYEQRELEILRTSDISNVRYSYNLRPRKMLCHGVSSSSAVKSCIQVTTDPVVERRAKILEILEIEMINGAAINIP